jgi:hypothetical protein
MLLVSSMKSCSLWGVLDTTLCDLSFNIKDVSVEGDFEIPDEGGKDYGI